MPDDAALATEAHLATLNPEQRAAATFGIARGAPPPGPLLVIAGAGSGKTSTLAHRLAHAVAAGADPFRILLLTFSRRSAQDLERRAGAILAKVMTPRAGDAARVQLPWAGTFHSVGARLLREYAPAIGLDESFTIQDRGDSEDLMAMVRHELALATQGRRFPGKATCLAIYSRAVNAGEPLAEVLATAFPWCREWAPQLCALFAAYTEAKQRQHVLDYDDLLLYWSLMAAEPALAAELSARFDHVLVDEYQDTNRLQSRILAGMKPDGRGLTVVGDDAQAIYSFRAATVRNILDFPRQFGVPVEVVTLDRNYRSTAAILAASNAVIALAAERFTKDLRTERASAEKPGLVTVPDEAAQARCAAERVLAHREAGIALKQQAVLFRTASHSAQLELELARRNIPFVKFGGLKFLESSHVKDVLALLRWVENPLGRVAAFRAVQLLPGIGPASAARLLDAMAGAAVPAEAMAAWSPPAAAAADWPAFLALYQGLRAGAAGWPAEMERVRAWYAPQLERLYEDAPARAGDIAQLAAMAGTFASRERFLTELTLDPPAATSDESGEPLRDEDYLILSTIHSAKGQEWRAVQVLNVVDGCIPSDLATGSADDIEEERRLLYVAMTRARDHLDLLVPARFHVHQQAAQGDRHVYALRSRFIPGHLLQHFDERAWPAPGAAPAMPARPAVRIDLAAKLKAAWRP